MRCDPAVLKCWARSGFANCDLDAQLTRRWIEKTILVGFLSNTRIEAPPALVWSVGYHATLVNRLGDSRKSACRVVAAFLFLRHDFRGPQIGRSVTDSRHDRSRGHGLPELEETAVSIIAHTPVTRKASLRTSTCCASRRRLQTAPAVRIRKPTCPTDLGSVQTVSASFLPWRPGSSP